MRSFNSFDAAGTNEKAATHAIRSLGQLTTKGWMHIEIPRRPLPTRTLSTCFTTLHRSRRQYRDPERASPPYDQGLVSTKIQSRRKHSHSESAPARSISSSSPLTVSGTDNSLSRVLFVFRLRYLFAIGVCRILSFTSNTARVPASLQKYRTHEIEGASGWNRLRSERDFHPQWYFIPEDFRSQSPP